MSQYDVYSGRTGGLFLDVQSDLIEGLSTRMIVPLLPVARERRGVSKLHPTLVIDGRDYLMATHFLAAFEKRNLGTPRANLMARHDDISRALYMLFQGF